MERDDETIDTGARRRTARIALASAAVAGIAAAWLASWERPAPGAHAPDAALAPRALAQPVAATPPAPVPLPPAAAQAGAEDGASPPIDCVIEPLATVRVAATEEGRLESVLVDRGDRVQQGQVVASLEAGVERAQLEVARAKAAMRGPVEAAAARAALDERNAERHRALAKQNVAAPMKVDEAEANLRRSTAELREENENVRLSALEFERAEAALERRLVRSPIDGVVVRRFHAAGEYTNSLDVVEIAQTNPLRVELLAPAELFGRIEVGAQADLAPEPSIGPPLRAQVTLVDPVIDAASGAFGVRIVLPNPEGRVPGGLRCQARIALAPARTAWDAVAPGVASAQAR